MRDIESVWSQIKKHEGEVFHQIRGGEFTYIVTGNQVIPNRTNVNISKTHIEEALCHYPLTNTVKLQHLRGPSYIYAIIMDRRIIR